MISFEKHQPTLQNPEQNPDVETMSIALEQKPLQESPEVQDQLQEAQNRADAAESTIVKETAQRDERIAETETLPRVVARKILIAAAAGLFVLGAAERAHGTEDVHPSTSTEAQWTILNAGSDVENNTAHDVDALQDIVPPNALRAQLAEAEAWDNLRKLQNKEHDLATALSVDFPYDISSQLTPEQEDALIKQMTEARIDAARQLFNPSGSTEHPEAAYRRAAANPTAEQVSTQSTSDDVTRVEQALGERLRNILPENIVANVSPEIIQQFIDDAAHISEDLSTHTALQQHEHKMNNTSSVDINATMGTFFHSRNTAPSDSDDAHVASHSNSAETILGIRFSGNLNNLSPEALRDAFAKEAQSYKDHPKQKLVNELLGYVITK